MLLALTLFTITVLVLVVQTAAFRKLYMYVDKELARPLGNYEPKASIILPCKGLDPGFNQNVERLLAQEYKNFEVIFAVASESDPAYQNLINLMAATKVPTKIVVAGINQTRAQKINNQLCALQKVSSDAEVLIFVDSDVIARSDFLLRLVAPLKDRAVGVSTGYRFYISSAHNLPSQLRSLWNRVSAWELANEDYAFAWGGAMAISKTTFETAQVAQSWDTAADDDLSLTSAVKNIGLKVHFVPQCLVASDGDASLSEIIEWTNRQLILTKVYYPKLWLRAISRAGIMATWLIIMLVCACGWMLSADRSLAWAVFAGLTILPVELCFMLCARSLWQRVLSERSQYIAESFWVSCAALPLAHLVLPWMTLFSLLTNRIQWRGITYELRSPTETLVISSVTT